MSKALLARERLAESEKDLAKGGSLEAARLKQGHIGNPAIQRQPAALVQTQVALVAKTKWHCPGWPSWSSLPVLSGRFGHNVARRLRGTGTPPRKNRGARPSRFAEPIAPPTDPVSMIRPFISDASICLIAPSMLSIATSASNSRRGCRGAAGPSPPELLVGLGHVQESKDETKEEAGLVRPAPARMWRQAERAHALQRLGGILFGDRRLPLAATLCHRVRVELKWWGLFLRRRKWRWCLGLLDEKGPSLALPPISPGPVRPDGAAKRQKAEPA